MTNTKWVLGAFFLVALTVVANGETLKGIPTSLAAGAIAVSAGSALWLSAATTRRFLQRCLARVNRKLQLYFHDPYSHR